MDRLRGRIEQLLSLKTHPSRQTEHKAFNRLLYCNRSQHRHGFYFRRLEHVRRLLTKIHDHPAWHSLRHAVMLPRNAGQHSKKQTPLSISSVTLSDLASIGALLEKAVTVVIPKTAVSVTLELISRGHFIPFAISMVAMLARLFVLEGKVLAEMKGVLVETSLLCHPDEPPEEKKKSHKASEDVGQPIPQPRETKSQSNTPKATAKDTKPNSHPDSSDVADKPIPVDKTAITLAEKPPGPSLYDIMAEHDPKAAQIAKSSARHAIVVTPTIDKPTEPTRVLRANRKRKKKAQTTENSQPSPHERPAKKKKRKRRNSDAAKQSSIPSRSSKSLSDSDDMDDIFGKLEN